MSGSASACCSLRCAVLFRVVSLTLQNTVLIEFSHDALAQEPQKENIKDAKVVLPPVHTHTSAPCASVERERESIRKKERGACIRKREGDKGKFSYDQYSKEGPGHLHMNICVILGPSLSTQKAPGMMKV